MSSRLLRIDGGLASVWFWRSVPSIQELIVLTSRTNRAAEGSISELILSCSQWKQNIPLWSSFTWFARASWKPVLMLLVLGFLGLKEITGTDITRRLPAALSLGRASGVVKTRVKYVNVIRNFLCCALYFKFSSNFLCWLPHISWENRVESGIGWLVGCGGLQWICKFLNPD